MTAGVSERHALATCPGCIFLTHDRLELKAYEQRTASMVTSFNRTASLNQGDPVQAS